MEMRAAAVLGLESSAQHVRPFARNSNATWRFSLPDSSRDADAVLIFGGDGTVHRHLAALVELQLPVLVVPHGSGNDFARALNLRSVRDSVNAWRQFCSGRGCVQQIDLGVIKAITASVAPAPQQPSLHTSGNQKPGTGNYFCCVGGIGLDAEIAKRANQLPRWIRRRGGYVLSLLPTLLGFRPPRVKVQSILPGSSGALGIQHDSPAMVVAFANAPAYGAGIKIAPHARLDDGKLDICVVGNMAKVRLLRWFPSVYSGSHLSIPQVKYFQTEYLRLETERPMDVYADGEYVCRTPVEVTMKRAALRVIVESIIDQAR
jgi:diacylglycerol kinase (ATP)